VKYKENNFPQLLIGFVKIQLVSSAPFCYRSEKHNGRVNLEIQMLL